MKQKNLYFYTNLLAWGLVLFLIGNYVFGWTTPSASPPSSNLPAPINAGPDSQTKAGNLTIQGNLTTGGVFRLGRFDTANTPSGTEGALYYDTTENTIKVYSDGTWQYLGGVAGAPLGSTCSLNEDCDSTYCIDGVCCDTSCTGGCEACNLTGSIGICTPRDADDTTEAPLACQRCDGANGLFQQQAADEGYLCIGNCTHCVGGSCVNYNDGTVCETGDICKACSSGTCTFVAAGSSGYGCTATHYRCNGSGACTAPTTLLCINSSCGLANCTTQCQAYNSSSWCLYGADSAGPYYSCGATSPAYYGRTCGTIITCTYSGGGASYCACAIYTY